MMNINKLYEGGCALIAEVLEKISNGEKIVARKQEDLGEAQYFSYPEKEELEKFLKIMELV